MKNLVPYAHNEKPSRKYGFSVLAIFRNESGIVREWIEHYLSFGAEHFYLINNNSTDDFLPVISDYIKKGIVELFDCSKDRYQVGAYTEILPILVAGTEWVGIFDLDEFIYPPHDPSIPAVIEKFKNHDSISIPLLNFGSNGFIQQPSLVVQFFIKRGQSDATRSFLKAISKTSEIIVPDQHDPQTRNNNKVLANGSASHKGSYLTLKESDIDDFLLINNHYRLQSLQSFKNSKLGRPEVSETTTKISKELSFFTKNDKVWNQVVDTRLRDIVNRDCQKYFIPIYGSYYHFITESALGLYSLLEKNGELKSLGYQLWYQGLHKQVIQMFSHNPIIEVPISKPYLTDAESLGKGIKTLHHVRLGTAEEYRKLIPMTKFLLDRIPIEHNAKGITIIERVKNRRYVETEELVKKLEVFGIPVRVVRLEEESFAAQVNLMRNTLILIAPHGAGTINQIFMPKGGQVIELFPKGYSNWHMKSMAEVFSHSFEELESKQASPFGRVPTEEIREKIEENGWPDRKTVEASRDVSQDLLRVVRDVKSFSIDPDAIINIVRNFLSDTTRKTAIRPEVSVVVPVYNKEQQIDFFIKALLRQKCTRPFEVIFIDDTSTDSSVKKIKEYLSKPGLPFSGVLIENESNQGNCVSRNKGIAAARGDILIVTDADCLLNANFIETYAQTYERTNADAVISDFGIEVGGRDPMAALVWYEEHPEMITVDRKLQDPLHPADFLNTVTRGFSIRRSALWPQLYDNQFAYTTSPDSGFGWEDIDVGCVLHAKGANIVYAEGAFTVHVSHPSIVAAALKPLRSLINFRKLHEKHPWLATERREWSLHVYRDIRDQQVVNGIALNDDNAFMESRLSLAENVFLKRFTSTDEVIVYTAIFGDRDVLQKPQRFKGVRYVCFTDNPRLRSSVWEIIYVSSNGESPRKQAKQYKILPHRFFPNNSYSIWIDATHVPRTNPRWMVKRFLAWRDIALFKHHRRDCLYEEAAECARFGLDDAAVISKQVDAYRKAGYPEGHGLATCSIIFRKHDEKNVIAAMEDWWQEICMGSIRDQISFNYIVDRHGISYFEINENVYTTPLFKRFYHKGTKEYRTANRRSIFKRVMRVCTREFSFYSLKRRKQNAYIWINSMIGRVGVRLKSISPRVYYFLKPFFPTR